jgi:hypothetical protein
LIVTLYCIISHYNLIKNMPVPINFYAVAVSMAISLVIGFIWYGPLFGKKWMALSGMVMPSEKPKFSVMLKPMILSLVGALFMACLMSIAIGISRSIGQIGIACALIIAFTNWLGFIVPVHLNFAGWEGKSWTLFAINTGYWLVYLLIISTIISVWM